MRCLFGNAGTFFADATLKGPGDRPRDKASLYAENFEYYGDHIVVIPSEKMTVSDTPIVAEVETSHGTIPLVEIYGPKFRALLHCEAERAKCSTEAS